MPRNTKPSQRKGKRKDDHHHEADEPLHKRLKNDAFDANRTLPPVLSTPNLQDTVNDRIVVPLLRNAATDQRVPLMRPIDQNQRIFYSSSAGPHPQPQQMPLAIRVRAPGVPVVNLQSHQLPELQYIQLGPLPQIIPSQIRTPAGSFYGHLTIQPGASITQPIPIVVSSNIYPGFPMAHVRSHNPIGPASVVFFHPGLNIPPILQQTRHPAPTPTTGPTQSTSAEPPEKSTLCLVCKKFFAPYNKFHEHYLAEHLDRSYRCTECLTRFPTITKLEDHQRVHQRKPEGRFLCADPKCKVAFENFQDLDKHFHECHILLDLVCDVCGRKFINSFEFNSHKESHN